MIPSALFGGHHRDHAAGASAAGAAARSESAAKRAERQSSHMEDRLERLSLVCMAMWSLIQDKTGLTEQDLMERVKLIDMMDGVDDGKASRSVRKCKACGRTMSPRHRKCLYCGAKELVTSAFDAV